MDPKQAYLNAIVALLPSGMADEVEEVEEVEEEKEAEDAEEEEEKEEEEADTNVAPEAGSAQQ